MRHEAHVGLVDAHAERDGGDDHDAVLVDEAILVARAHAGVEAGVIGQRRHAGLGQRGRGILDLGARQAIDDAGIAGVAFADEGLELRRRVLLVDDLVADIRAVETRDKARRIGEPQPLGDLLARQVIGGRGQRDARHIGKTLAMTDRPIYSGRKSCPHCDTQCASSIANSAICAPSRPRQRGVSSRSGAT